MYFAFPHALHTEERIVDLPCRVILFTKITNMWNRHDVFKNAIELKKPFAPILIAPYQPVTSRLYQDRRHDPCQGTVHKGENAKFAEWKSSE